MLTLALLSLPSGSVAKPVEVEDSRVPGHYIVVLKDSIVHPGAVARAQTDARGGELGFVYRHALKGYSAELSRRAVEALRKDPRVDYVSPDHREELLDAQEMPTGIPRAFPTDNEMLEIDGEDDVRVDADVAVIDEGIDSNNFELNVVARTACMGPPELAECVDGAGTAETGHGTHVAGTVGALDNGLGVVGMAPGVRLWDVDVFEPIAYESHVAAGVDWVTGHASEIEVANMSLGCPLVKENEKLVPCPRPVAYEAISNSVKAGVVYVVAAGNNAVDAKYKFPAYHPDVITVSALVDYDGKPGGEAEPTCRDRGPDDTLAVFSDWGEDVEVAAPGVCILSTTAGGKYEMGSGTSMASPHVAGAAALLASQSNPEDKEDVEAIRDTIVDTGNFDWEDTSGDGIEEPLLDVSDEEIFDPVIVHLPTVTTKAPTGLAEQKATLQGVVNPNGSQTTYRFEYGTSAKYGQSIPVTPQSVGTGTEDVAVDETIEGLNPAATYHFRLVSSNSSGTFYGEDVQFTTWGEWSLNTTPNPKALEQSSLADVSCPSSTVCLSMGYDEYERRGFAQSWNGTEWKLLKGALDRKPTALACSSTAKCFEIGEKPDGSFYTQRWVRVVGVWNKTGGEVAPATPEGGSQLKLKGISCFSEYTCTTVGSYVKEGKTKPLIERYNEGSGTWSTQAPATSASEAELRDVSCPSSSECFAVGREGLATTPKPLIERWNGTSWSTQAAPLPAGKSYASLSKVSCSSASACMASGSISIFEGGGPWAARWDGKEWSLATSGLTAVVSDVHCSSSTFCLLAGEKEGKTLIQAWNGSSWSAQSSPNPEGKTPSLAAVSCASTSSCATVGKASFGVGEKVTLGERYGAVTPTVVTEPATTASGEGMKLNALVNPNGLETTYEFEYGASTEYGQSVPVTPQSIGAGVQDVAVAETIEGLNPGNVYHFRIVATNERGTAYGSDMEFTTWSLQATPSPKVQQKSSLADVSCPSSTVCLAVGYDEYERRGFAQSWNGTEWQLLKGVMERKPVGLACGSTTKCFAIGEKPDGSFYTQRWVRESGSWSVTGVEVAPATPEGGSQVKLKGISCASEYTCTTVGSYVKEGKTKPLIERYNEGSGTWSTQAPATGASEAELRDVSCPSSSECFAVGLEGGEITPKPLIERWNGTSWSTQAAPLPAGKSHGLLIRLSCSSATSCMATGRPGLLEGGGPFAARWDGKEWSIAGSGFEASSDVSCVSASACIAVGAKGSATLIQAWNGGSWSTQSSPNPEGKAPALAAISCASTVACATVGQASFDGGEKVTLAESWNGASWSIDTTPNPEVLEKSYLTDLSCIAPKLCLAVGYDEQERRTLAESWNGEEWKLIQGALERKPTALGCGSTTRCSVIGEKLDGSPYTQLWLRVEGSWVDGVEPSLAIPSGGSQLEPRGISCAGGWNCTTVGSYVKEGKTKPLIERYSQEGEAWSTQASATSGEAELHDVSCPSSSECFAVGHEGLATTPKPLIERWNGTSWSTQAAPLPAGKSYASLTHLSCSSAGACMAIGNVSASEGGAPFAARWDGNEWSLASVGLESVNDVTCVWPGVCLVVDEKEGETLVQAWNGSSWSAQSSPNPEGKAPALTAISCSSTSFCTAVGHASFGEEGKIPLTLLYD